MPGLLTLKTDLKSLRYGQDQPGGGSSRQPYITTDINTVDTDFNQLRLTKFDDGLIRGGIIGATNSAIVDTLRIGKFFLDVPKGPLFLIKQVGLQLSNPRLEIPKNLANIAAGTPSNPLSVATNGLLQPSRIYNLGVNTLLQIPVNALGGHIVRHGLLPIQSDASKYEAIVAANNDDFLSNDPSRNNRLIALSRKFELGNRSSFEDIIPGRSAESIDQFFSTLSSNTSVSIISPFRNEETTIDDYIGGPSSVYGIGRTSIKRYSNTEDGFKIFLAKQFSTQFAGKTRDNNNDPVTVNYTSDLGIGKNAISNYKDGIQNYIDRNVIDASINKNVIGAVKTYDNLKTQINKTTKSQLEYKSNSFTSPLLSGIVKTVGEQLPSSNEQISYTNTYGDNIVFTKNWREGTREKRVGSGRQDVINLTPIFTGNAYFSGDGPGDIYRDLVKFRIQAIDTANPNSGKWMVFRAYLTDLSDDTSPEWQDIKYAGRGDKFYIYSGFTRKINVSFKIAALSAGEMQFIYQKLNFLMGNGMPDYSRDGLMRGPLVRMTIGNWIDSQLGILNSISLKVPQDSPWEIAMDEPEGGTRQLILPHIVEVSLGFTPIGSETGVLGEGTASNKISEKSMVTSHIAQNTTGIDVKTLQYIYSNDRNYENLIEVSNTTGGIGDPADSEYQASTGGGGENYQGVANERGYTLSE